MNLLQFVLAGEGVVCATVETIFFSLVRKMDESISPVVPLIFRLEGS